MSRPGISRRSAAALLAVLVLLAALLLLLPCSHPGAQDRANILAPASAHHLTGTDSLGRDRLLRCAAALLLCLAGASAASAVCTALAAVVGVAAAAAPRAVCRGLLLGCDVLLVLPTLFLLMMARGALPLTASPGLVALITFGLLAVLGWPACARAVFRSAQQLLGSGPVLHGRACGLGPAALAWTHLLPGLFALLWPQFLVTVPAFVAAEANLGSLGLGVPEPLPSWGGMVAELAGSVLTGPPPAALFPLALLAAVLLLLQRIATPSAGSRIARTAR